MATPHKRKTQHRGPLRTIAVSLLVVLNVVALLLLWGICLATLLRPTLHPHAAVCGLFFPIAFLVNLLFLPLWLLVRLRGALLPLIGMLPTLGIALDYCPLHLTKPLYKTGLTLMSWNMENLEHKGVAENLDSVFNYIDSIDADILCLQECAGGKPVWLLRDHLTERGYHWATRNGRTLYSRFPILSTETLPMATILSNGVNLHKVLLSEGDTLTIVNTHLESNYLTRSDRYDGKAALRSLGRTEIEGEGRHILGKLARSQRMRGAQIDTLLAAVDSLRLRGASIIVSGDFNDTPVSYVYQRLAHRLPNAYREAGRGVGVSYNERYFLFRIDHLFHTPDWHATSAHIDNSVIFSDHYPLVVRIHR